MLTWLFYRQLYANRSFQWLLFLFFMVWDGYAYYKHRHWSIALAMALTVLLFFTHVPLFLVLGTIASIYVTVYRWTHDL